MNPRLPSRAASAAVHKCDQLRHPATERKHLMYRLGPRESDWMLLAHIRWQDHAPRIQRVVLVHLGYSQVRGDKAMGAQSHVKSCTGKKRVRWSEAAALSACEATRIEVTCGPGRRHHLQCVFDMARRVSSRTAIA